MCVKCLIVSDLRKKMNESIKFGLVLTVMVFRFVHESANQTTNGTMYIHYRFSASVSLIHE